jgi:hypothetical protein
MKKVSKKKVIKSPSLLKLKSIIYKYTGIFLPHREECEYVASNEYWKQFNRILKHENKDLSPRNIHGLLVGSWQAHNGFARPFSMRFLLLGHGRWYKPLFNVLCWFDTLYLVIKWDLQSLNRRTK